MFYILVEGLEHHALVQIKNLDNNIMLMVGPVINEYFDYMNPSIGIIFQGNLILKNEGYAIYDILKLIDEIKNYPYFSTKYDDKFKNNLEVLRNLATGNIIE